MAGEAVVLGLRTRDGSQPEADCQCVMGDTALARVALRGQTPEFGRSPQRDALMVDATKMGQHETT